MFTLQANTKPTGTDRISARARSAGASVVQSAQSAADAAQSAAQAAQAAAQTAAMNASTAAQTATNQVRQRVRVARGWAAPQLESAADYCTATAAPRVSSALRSAARQVRPEETGSRRGIRSVIAWAILGVAVLAGAGAAAAFARSRWRATMAADADAIDTGDSKEPDGTASPADQANLVKDPDADARVNGHVSGSGW